MFARIVEVKNGKVTIDGTEYPLEVAVKMGLVEGIGKDDDGNTYAIVK